MLRFLALGISLGLLSVRGAVTWSTDQVELRATSLDPKVTATYRFKNSGLVAERVARVDGGCSCTVPKGVGALVAPGESGVVEIDFLIGDRTGLQERVITVVTEGATEAVHRLNLSLRIQEVLTVRPRLLLWTKGEAPTSKRTEITVSDGFEIEFDAPVVVGGGFTAVLERSQGSSTRVLVVTPDSLASVQNSEIKLTARHAGREKTLVVFSLVR
ncbi:MAG: DUF1573 domain-containing protein [Opitutaceae bacterium]|nr:DUF1573 domain-containing protein [Opitutaceae bacterium]